LLKTSLRFLLPFGVSGFLLYWLSRHFDFKTAIVFITNADSWRLAAAFLIIGTAYVARACRWLIWERQLTFANSFKLILIGFMGNNILPARLGELLRAYCTARNTGDSYGGTAALASVAIERVLDGFVLSCIAVITLFLVTIARGYTYSLVLVSILFAVLAAALIVSISLQRQLRIILTRIHAAFPGHLTRFGEEKLNFFLDGLLLIQGRPRLLTALTATALIWAIELNAYFLIANAVFPGLSWRICALFLVVVNFASLFPFTLGGIGAIESAATLSLISVGVPEYESLAMVAIQHSFQFLSTTMAGGLFYFTDGYYRTAAASKSPARSITSMSSDAQVEAAHARIAELVAGSRLQRKEDRQVDLSIVIPGYNESARLPKTILETVTWGANSKLSYEILFVDDGSKDDTLSIVQMFARLAENIRFISCPHLGKGSAVRMGMLNAAGRNVLFMDADGATPLTEIPRLITRLQIGADVVIGSRVAQQPGEIQVITSLRRRLIGRIFSGFVNIVAMPGFADTQCGFKLFRGDVVRNIFSRQRMNGFAFDVEILFIATRLGYTVEEVPINWVNQAGSKVNLVTDSLKMLIDVLRIKWIHRFEQWETSPMANDARLPRNRHLHIGGHRPI
jgi:dolichyl-phosphate beta-glucosyltransferase